jgi:hypothetical protein
LHPLLGSRFPRDHLIIGENLVSAYQLRRVDRLHLFIFEDEAAAARHDQSEAVKRFEAIYSPELVGGDVVFTDYEMVAGKPTAEQWASRSRASAWCGIASEFDGAAEPITRNRSGPRNSVGLEAALLSRRVGNLSKFLRVTPVAVDLQSVYNNLLDIRERVEYYA